MSTSVDKQSSSTPSELRRIIHLYTRCCDFLSIALGVIAAFALLAGVVTVCQMAFVRYVLGQSTVWQTEFATYSVAASMLLGSAYVLLTGGHVSVNLLQQATQGKVRFCLWLSSALIGWGFCLALSYGFWLYFIEAYHDAWTTGSVWNPQLWPALLPMAVGSSMLAAQYLAEILKGEQH